MSLVDVGNVKIPVDMLKTSTLFSTLLEEYGELEKVPIDINDVYILFLLKQKAITPEQLLNAFKFCHLIQDSKFLEFLVELWLQCWSTHKHIIDDMNDNLKMDIYKLIPLALVPTHYHHNKVWLQEYVKNNICKKFIVDHDVYSLYNLTNNSGYTLQLVSLKNDDHYGPTIMYNSSDTITEIKYYIDNKVHSETKILYHDGITVKETYTYVYDIKHGECKTWHPDGTTMESACTYVNGTLHGVYRSWYPDGSKYRIGNLKHGQHVGNQECWLPTGQLESQFTFPDEEEGESGPATGREFIYNDDGSLQNIIHHSNS